MKRTDYKPRRKKKILFFHSYPTFFSKKGVWTAFLSKNRCRFEKAVLSDFRFAVQMSLKSNCIWTADKRMGGNPLFMRVTYPGTRVEITAVLKKQKSGALVPAPAVDEGFLPPVISLPEQSLLVLPADRHLFSLFFQ